MKADNKKPKTTKQIEIVRPKRSNYSDPLKVQLGELSDQLKKLKLMID